MGRVGVLGGTFDPPHLGHLAAAEEVRSALHLDTVLWIPNRNPPHKTGRAVTDTVHRLEMLRLAISDNPRFTISEIELGREGPSYTVDTLRELRARFPDEELTFFMGADEFASLRTWNRPELLPLYCRLAIMTRAGVELDTRRVESQVSEIAGAYELVPVPDLRISSSDLRARAATGRPVRYLVPEPVREYILSTGIYNSIPADC